MTWKWVFVLKYLNKVLPYNLAKKRKKEKKSLPCWIIIEACDAQYFLILSACHFFFLSVKSLVSIFCEIFNKIGTQIKKLKYSHAHEVWSVVWCTQSTIVSR